MMTTRPLLVPMLLLGAIGLLPAAAHAGEFAGHVNFFLGTKYLEDDWAPLDQHGAFGAEMSWGSTDWPVFIASDVFVSADVEEGTFLDTVAVTTELDLGVRKIWELGRTYPFVGGGMGIMTGYLDNDITDDRDAAAGPWINGGVFWRLGPRFNIGLSARWSSGDVRLFGQELDAGGFQFGLLLGFGWPGK